MENLISNITIADATKLARKKQTFKRFLLADSVESISKDYTQSANNQMLFLRTAMSFPNFSEEKMSSMYVAQS